MEKLYKEGEDKLFYKIFIMKIFIIQFYSFFAQLSTEYYRAVNYFMPILLYSQNFFALIIRIL